MAFPLIGWALVTLVPTIAYIGKKIYDVATEPDSPSIREESVFLTGETGVGKDSIFHILKDARFVDKHKATSKLYKEDLMVCQMSLELINTAGSRENDDENIEARRNLRWGTKYVYVFKADDYLADKKVKKQVQMDLKNAKEQSEEQGWTLKIIGTHKDKALENGASEAEIQKLEKELSQNAEFKCKILDLTNFNGNKKQKELCDFIVN